MKYNDEDTTTEIGDNVTIRECVTINRGTTDKMKTVVGDNCLIMAYCHIAHDSFVGENCIFSFRDENRDPIYSYVKTNDNYEVLDIQEKEKISNPKHKDNVILADNLPN